MGEIFRKFDCLFPEQHIYNRRLKVGSAILAFVFLTLIFFALATIIPADGFIGYDWVYFFKVKTVPAYYQPWTIAMVDYLNYRLLVGITIAAFSLASYLRSVHIISAIASFLCLPLFWVLFLGQIDGLSVLGLLGLPWLIPLVLVKPQITIFAVGAKKVYILALFIWIAMSIMIWGNWLPNILLLDEYY